MPRASVVIACYNQGRYLDEALDSALAQTHEDLEIVIVNDGSTDPATNEKTRSLRRPRTRVIHTENQGLPAARNTGIRAAQGQYILPLDADDRLAPGYLEKAVAVLEARPEVGIVYSEAEYFDGQSGKWEMPPYALSEMLLHNLIHCSAVFRKADWERVGGYKPLMKHGWEDWEFWLSLLELNREVHRIPETLFFYRRKPESMIAEMARLPERIEYSFEQVFLHHLRLYAQYAPVLFRNRWIFEGRERLVPRLLPHLVARGQDLQTLPARAAATFGLLAWAAQRGLRASLGRLASSLGLGSECNLTRASGYLAEGRPKHGETQAAPRG
jgi:glycosyltransferase involved in cell wall biosynthesis